MSRDPTTRVSRGIAPTPAAPAPAAAPTRHRIQPAWCFQALSRTGCGGSVTGEIRKRSSFDRITGWTRFFKILLHPVILSKLWFSLHPAEHGLEVAPLGNLQQERVVRGGAGDLEHLERAARLPRRPADRLQEVRLAHQAR